MLDNFRELLGPKATSELSPQSVEEQTFYQTDFMSTRPKSLKGVVRWLNKWMRGQLGVMNEP